MSKVFVTDTFPDIVPDTFTFEKEVVWVFPVDKLVDVSLTKSLIVNVGYANKNYSLS